MDKRKKGNNKGFAKDLESIAWGMFNQSGNVADYLLYKKLTEKE